MGLGWRGEVFCGVEFGEEELDGFESGVEFVVWVWGRVFCWGV